MASTSGSLRQRLALRSASARLSAHSAWLHAATPLGPELTRRVRGEVDHHAMAVDAAHASALVQLVVLVDSLELDAHAAPLNDGRDMVATPAAPRSLTGSRPLASQSWEASSPTKKVMKQPAAPVNFSASW